MELDTLPKLVKYNWEKYGDKKIAMRRKDFGVWNEYTWEDSYQIVRHFSLGMISLGLQEGDKVSIIGDNAPEWFWAEYAIQAAGGIVIGLYTDGIPNELKYILDHSESKFVVAEDQEQVDKLLSIIPELPRLINVIYWDDKGLWNYNAPVLKDFYDLVKLGRQYESEHPGLFEQNVDRGKGDAPAILMYTSGTSGLPKAAIVEHKVLIKRAEAINMFTGLSKDDNYVSWVSPAWIAEQVFGMTCPLLSGTTVNFVEEPETTQVDIREIGPEFITFGSRQWESLASTVQFKMSNSATVKRLLYDMCMAIGYKLADTRIARGEPSLFWRILGGIAYVALHRPLLDKLGFSNARYALTGAGTCGPDTVRLFLAMGIRLHNNYSLTEMMPVTNHRDDDVRPETVGPPVEGVEVRIADDGEIMCRSIYRFTSYYKEPEITAKTIDTNGWIHTADGGYVSDDGHLVFTDRVKDLRSLKTGYRFAPQYIEGRLRFDPYINNVMVIGGEDRDYVTAIIDMDYKNVGQWAEDKNIPYTTYADLSQKPQACDLIGKAVEKVNSYLPEPSRIRKFSNLHKEFDPDEAELTRSRKLRRSFLEQHYAKLIDALYSEVDKVAIEAEITYQDGRKGTIKTEVRINSVGDEHK